MDKATIKELHKCSFLRSLMQISINWGSIFLIIWVCEMYWSIPLYMLAVILISAQMQGLGINLHDGIHGQICRNRFINDFISTFVIALPANTSYEKFKATHLAHHRHLNTEEDPDWVNQTKIREQFPMPRYELLKMLLLYAFGGRVILGAFRRKGWRDKLKFIYNAFIFVRPPFETKPTTRGLIISYSFYITLFAVLLYFGHFTHYLLYWIVPGLTWLQVVITIRGMAEHYCVEDNTIYDKSRTTYATIFDKLILGKMWNVGYHLDHHIYPGVPSYNLKKLHKELLKDSNYKTRSHLTYGYHKVIEECTI